MAVFVGKEVINQLSMIYRGNILKESWWTRSVAFNEIVFLKVVQIKKWMKMERYNWLLIQKYKKWHFTVKLGNFLVINIT